MGAKQTKKLETDAFAMQFHDTPEEFKVRAKKISIVSEAIKTGIEVRDAA